MKRYLFLSSSRHPRRQTVPDKALVPILMALVVLALPPGALQAVADETELTEEFLNDPENIRHGQELWRQQCVKCHGTGSYPGKAPKLNPRRMDPEEIYLKTTYGFGRMPAWEDVFSDHERMAITAYMKSDRFSP
jgi:mono/diheme cytochrome c family protein